MPRAVHIALMITCGFWGISFIASKAALTSIPPLTVATLRLVVASLCFLIWIRLRRVRLHFSGWHGLGTLAVLSLFNTSLHYGLQTMGLKYTTAVNASLYCLAGPIVILLISVAWLGETLNWKKTAGIGLALLGVLLVMGVETLLQLNLTSHLLGDLLVISSITMWGIFTVMSKQMNLKRQKVGAIEIAAITTWLGTVQMLPLSIWEMQHQSFHFFQVSLTSWAAVGFLGLTCSFLAVLLYVWALTQTQSQKVAVYLYTITPLTYFFAVILLDEKLSSNLLLGSLLVFVGVLLTEKG